MLSLCHLIESSISAVPGSLRYQVAFDTSSLNQTCVCGLSLMKLRKIAAAFSSSQNGLSISADTGPAPASGVQPSHRRQGRVFSRELLPRSGSHGKMLFRSSSSGIQMWFWRRGTNNCFQESVLKEMSCYKNVSKYFFFLFK